MHHVLRMLVPVTSVIKAKSLKMLKFCITQQAQVYIGVITQYSIEPLVQVCCCLCFLGSLYKLLWQCIIQRDLIM